MEVPGRRESSNNGTNQAVILCQPCQGDDDTVPAEGYCETCNEFICNSCIKAHRKLAVTKNHVIKSKDEMPTFLTRSDPCTEICADHTTETVKFYCQEHDCVGCGDCMVLEHKSCKVQLITDVSSNYGNSEELIRIRHKIDHLKKNLASCKHEIKCSLEAVDAMKAKVIKEIKTFRKEMNIYLDEVEAALIEEIEELYVKDVSLQKKLQDECESLENELEEFQSKLDQYLEKVNQLFATSKRVQKRLKQCQEVYQNIASRSQVNICRFEPSKEMTAFKTNHSPLGNIGTIIKKFHGPSRRSIIEMEAYLVGKTKVQFANEEKCWITGMAMVSYDDILLADGRNCSLKILNVSNCKVTSRIKPPGKPWDVTVINSETAATTLPEEGKILFVNTNNGLSESHSLKVRNGCAGIDHHSSKIAVSFYSPPAIQVLDMKGHILHEVSDTSIFKSPYYICLSNDNERMFVSDVGKHSVYELTIDGELKATIKFENLTYPAAIAVTTNGTVVVCGRKRVNMIVPGTSEILPLMQQNLTTSILVCEEQNKMYISEHIDENEASFIKIFDLK